MDSVLGYSIPYIFIFHPKSKKDIGELSYLMSRDGFDYPVWIDYKGEFNKKNKLPIESMFHSFLLDKQNKVIAVGDPFQNPKIYELYLKIIWGDVADISRSSTNAAIYLNESTIELGEFEWSIPQRATFTLRNNGESRLVINDIVSSCGCISVDYLRSPVDAGKDIVISVTYKAEKPEYVNKSLTIYTNLGSSLKVMIKGNAR